MRIFLLFGFALDLRVDGFQGRPLLLCEGQAGRFGAAPVTSLHQLEDEGGGFGGNRRELQQPLGAGNLTVFELQPLLLRNAKERLDDPAQLVPGDDLPSRVYARDVMGGEPPPVQRLDAGRGVVFGDLDESEAHAWQEIASAAPRAFENYRAEAQRQTRRAARLVRPAPGQHDRARVGRLKIGPCRVQPGALGQATVLHDARQNTESLARAPSPS